MAFRNDKSKPTNFDFWHSFRPHNHCKMCTRVELQFQENSQHSIFLMLFSSENDEIIIIIHCLLSNRDLCDYPFLLPYSSTRKIFAEYLHQLFGRKQGNRLKWIAFSRIIFDIIEMAKCKIVAISWFCDLAYYTRLKSDALNLLG